VPEKGILTPIKRKESHVMKRILRREGLEKELGKGPLPTLDCRSGLWQRDRAEILEVPGNHHGGGAKMITILMGLRGKGKNFGGESPGAQKSKFPGGEEVGVLASRARRKAGITGTLSREVSVEGQKKRGGF